MGGAGHASTSRSDDASSLLDEAALHAAGLSVPGRSQLDLVPLLHGPNAIAIVLHHRIAVFAHAVLVVAMILNLV